MKENWGHEGMPPIYVDVVDKKIVSKSEGYELAHYWLAGAYPHYGRVIRGYTGVETDIWRETVGERIRYVKDRFITRSIL